MKQFVKSLQQILANHEHTSWRAFELSRLFFAGFRICWFILQSIFDPFYVLLNWFFNVFLESIVKKQFNFIVSLQYREIRTIKTATLWKLHFIFFHENSRKEEEEADTNFVLLSQSRNVIGQFIKTYLHDQSRIYNSSHLENSNCSTLH